MSDFHIGV